MKTLVLGHKGMLGSDLVAELERRGHSVVGLDLPEFDISDPMAGAKLAAGRYGRVEWLLNCAAYTAVDRAETESDEAMKANALGPGYVARACAINGSRMLHVSTDFVFDGTKESPYDESDQPNPLGAYGHSKLEGEKAVRTAGCEALVVRTAWLFGPNGQSFPRTMIRAWRAGKSLRVVADQQGSPTYTADLARVLVDLVERSPDPGLYHAAGPEAMSWHAFALRALESYREATSGKNEPIAIEPIATEDWPTPARRPRNSVLSFAKVAALGIEPMRPLAAALEEFSKRLPADI